MAQETRLIIVALFAAVIALGVFLLFFDSDGNIIDISFNSTESGKLNTFSSYDEIVNFVRNNRIDYGTGEERAVGGAPAMASEAKSADASASSASADSYSTTNIQVEGVDEPDFVKNDGKYIYVLSGNKLSIVEAYPASDMRILSSFNVSGNYGASNMFLNDDKLIVLGNGYENVRTGVACPIYETGAVSSDSSYIRCGSYGKQLTYIYVYDISDRSSPELEYNISIDGNYVNARMIGDYVYLISSKPIYLDYGYGIELPVYRINGVESSIPADRVHYFDSYDNNYIFTSIGALNLRDGEFNSEVYLSGYTGVFYMSAENIYLTYHKQIGPSERFDGYIETILPLLPDSERGKVEDAINSDIGLGEKQRRVGEIVRRYDFSLYGKDRADFDSRLSEALSNYSNELQRELQKTAIQKIGVDEKDIEYKGSGEVPGYVLNQFSMDEHDGNFRIATTTGGFWGGESSANNLYVLDSSMDVVGRVEDLASGERIYSVRFMGERAYMVTFRQVDPLFVINLEDARNPRVLGYLKVTGYSSYLHPYDENNIIGIGMEANEQGRVSGLKVALFDVSDVANPKEKAKFLIENYSSSSALYDHKAFLFDRERNLLVIPVHVYNYNLNWNSWDGAYVFYIDGNSLSLRGKVTHYDYKEPIYGLAKDEEVGATRKDRDGNIWTKIGKDMYGNGMWRSDSNVINYDFSIDRFPGGISESVYQYGYEIQRSLYMDDTLYTVSWKRIKANELGSISEINKIELPYLDYGVGYAV